MRVLFNGAGDEARTRYLHLGKVALYQMSYARVISVYYSNRILENVKREFLKFAGGYLIRPHKSFSSWG